MIQENWNNIDKTVWSKTNVLPNHTTMIWKNIMKTVWSGLKTIGNIDHTVFKECRLYELEYGATLPLSAHHLWYLIPQTLPTDCACSSRAVILTSYSKLYAAFRWAGYICECNSRANETQNCNWSRVLIPCSGFDTLFQIISNHATYSDILHTQTITTCRACSSCAATANARGMCTIRRWRPIPFHI